MKDDLPFIQAAQLDVQATNLILSILPLRQQIQKCNSQLATLLRVGRDNQADVVRIRDLKDEIFGCKIEIQALCVKARRLNLKARHLRLAEANNQFEVKV